MKFITVLFFTVITCFHVVAQQTAEGEAEKQFSMGKYQAALPLFQKLLKKNPSNPRLNFYVGYCFYNSPSDKTRSIPFFERALKDPTSEFYYDLKYYLSRAYHLANRFDDAIASFNSMKEAITDNKSGKELLRDINRQIEMCNYGKTLVENPRKVNIMNLGKPINTEYPEYAPIISADESVMIFTSRRKGSTGGTLDENGEFYEDIYSTDNEFGKWKAPTQIDSMSEPVILKPKWSKAKKLGRAINTEKHDAAIGLSADGQKLFIYRNEDVYISNLKGKNWANPAKLNSSVNTKFNEPSASLSADEKTLYFVSTRKGGIGGKDIYKAERLANGEWGPAQNLGTIVNTPFDEEAPFIQSDGKTLYFSSKGHTSMGGYDIFKCTFENGKWSSPENIGYPINTSDDDIYFVVSARGDHGYFSSVRPKGFGHMDIYLVTFEGVSIPLTEVKGLVLAGDSLKPTGARIVVTDNATGKQMGAYTANSESGKYLLIFPPGRNYKMVVTADGFEPHTENVFVPDQKSYYQLYQEIHFQYVKSPTGKPIGQKVSLQNAFFDINKYVHSDSALFSNKDTTAAYSAYLKFVNKSDTSTNKSDSLVYLQKDVIAYYDPADSLAAVKKSMEVAIKSDNNKKPGLNTDVSIAEALKNLPGKGKSTRREQVKATEADTATAKLTLYYGTDVYLLDSTLIAELERISSQLQQKTIRKINIEGHTDNTGPAAYNKQLGLLRAKAARQYFIEKGIEGKRIKIQTYGLGRPIKDNSTEEGRRKNRRTEIFIY